MFKRSIGSKKRKFVVLSIVAVVVGMTAFGAYAWWSATGSGTGTATTTAATTAVTVHQTSTATGLYPGGSKSLSGNFDNPNPGKVYIASVTASVVSVDATHTTAGCDFNDFTITGTSNTPGEIVSGNGVGSWSGLTLNMTDTAVSQDACKGATVNLSYTAS